MAERILDEQGALVEARGSGVPRAAYFEIEELGRAREAMLRLLERVDTQAADPNLFVGLVVACRFCGLLQADVQVLRHTALWMLGREKEALVGVQEMEPHWPSGPEHWFLKSLQAAFLGDREKCVQATTKIFEIGFHDPEGLLFSCVRNLARVGETDLALTTLTRAVEGSSTAPLRWCETRGFTRCARSRSSSARSASRRSAMPRPRRPTSAPEANGFSAS